MRRGESARFQLNVRPLFPRTLSRSSPTYLLLFRISFTSSTESTRPKVTPPAGPFPGV